MELDDVEDDSVKHLIITGVKPIDDRKLGRKYKKLFVVDYNGVACAAKRQKCDDSFSISLSPRLSHRYNISLRNHCIPLVSGAKEKFLQECLLHSKLHHQT